jgi:hypothetical protein
MSSSTTKPVTLEGSCHCQRVKFSVDSCLYIYYLMAFFIKVFLWILDTPYPYMICHCLADTKTAGVFNCNIMGEYSTFKIKQGQEFVKIYQAKLSEIESGNVVLIFGLMMIDMSNGFIHLHHVLIHHYQNLMIIIT